MNLGYYKNVWKFYQQLNKISDKYLYYVHLCNDERTESESTVSF